MKRLTTYLTTYGGIFSDMDRFPYRHGTSNDVSDDVWWDFFRHGSFSLLPTWNV